MAIRNRKSQFQSRIRINDQKSINIKSRGGPFEPPLSFFLDPNKISIELNNQTAIDDRTAINSNSNQKLLFFKIVFELIARL